MGLRVGKTLLQSRQKDKCLDICDEINLWFSEGKYVKKASDLKRKINNQRLQR